MEQPAKKGRIYVFSAPANTEALTKKSRAACERLARQSAPYYLVLRRDDEQTVLCVPLTERNIKHSVEIVVDGEKYYAGYLEFIKIKDSWLKYAYASTVDLYPVIDQIYRLRQTHNKYVTRRHKEKRQRELNDRKMMRELRDGNGTNYPKERGSSTVSWKMTHPAQGGRTSPK